jgi:hypothetical protein
MLGQSGAKPRQSSAVRTWIQEQPVQQDYLTAPPCMCRRRNISRPISNWLERLRGPAVEAGGSRARDRRCSKHETAANVSPTLAGLAEARTPAPGSMTLHPDEVAPRRELSGGGWL